MVSIPHLFNTPFFPKILLLFISFILLLFSYFSYPIVRGDSIFFIPTAINVAQGKGLINELGYLSLILDKFHGQDFIYYPPLFPLILAKLSYQPTLQGIYFSSAIIAIFSLFLLYIIINIFRKKLAHAPDIKFNGILSIILIGHSTGYITGNMRPELLSKFILLTFIYLNIVLFKRKHFFIIVNAVLLGITLLIHIYHALIFALLLALYYSIRFRWIEWLKYIFLTALTAITLFVLGITTLSPFGLLRNLDGIYSHIKLIQGINIYPEKISPNLFFGFNLLDTGYFFYLPIALLFLGIVIFITTTYWGKIRAKGIFLVVLVLSIYLIYIIPTLREFPYYLYLIIPLMYVGIFVFIFYFKPVKFLFSIILILLILPMGGVLREVILFPFFLTQGVSLEKARADYTLLRSQDTESLKNNEKIGITVSLWPLTYNFSELVSDDMLNKTQLKIPYFLKQQIYSGNNILKESYNSCTLIYNNFVSGPVKIFGIKLANNVPGYSFATYDCK